MTTSETIPVWQSEAIDRYGRLNRRRRFDVVVIGGGMTGLSAAYFLKRAGKKVCVLERDRLGDGDTGHTTAHLTQVTDMRLKDLFDELGRERAALAWYAGAAAIDLIEHVVTEHGLDCEFRRVPGFLHASLDDDEDESERLKEEVNLARDLGFDAEFIARVPIVNKPGMRIPNQAKFHPRAYLAGLASLVEGNGSKIFENTEVTGVENEPLVVVANGVRVSCEYVVVATHVPLVGNNSFLQATMTQTKLTPQTSYVVSGNLPPGQAPEVSLWDTSDPYYYLRVDGGLQNDRVIFGGKDHKTGQAEDSNERYEALEEKLKLLLPRVTLEHRWSGQVIETTDGLPFIGEMNDRQFVATGFNGNGITFGTLAGMMARDSLMAQENPWQELFSFSRKAVRGNVWEYVKQNLDFPYYFAADRIGGADKSAPAELARGEGKILKVDGQRVACCRDEDGKLHQVSPVCTHMGCIVHWNDAEQTWDCPCHGSRFRANGEVLAGPAETPLEPAGKGAKTPAST